MFRTPFQKGCLLVLGGAKSGKSTAALNVCNAMDCQRIFLATAQAWDEEMAERIRRHQAERGTQWLTIEEPIDVVRVIEEHDEEGAVILLDCLTLWLNNLFMKYEEDHDGINREINKLTSAASEIKGALVAVSNEVGTGIVPENAMARRYRDTAGILNQQIAAVSRKVLMTFAGLPMVLKDE